jgi:hypothetical protein
MSRHHWDDALRLLHEALAVEPAANREEARALHARAQQGQAGSLLEAAEKAVAQKGAAQALNLLRDYLAHPQATELQRATALRAEVERATTDAEAARCLEAMSDQALTRFARGGPLPGDAPFIDAGAREIFKDTLRRHLPHEEQKREARRARERAEAARLPAVRARQEARLRGTLPYVELADFVRTTARKVRNHRDLTVKQEQALAVLFRQLNVTDRREQARIRAGLQEGYDTAGIEASVARKREEAKQAFRRSKSFSRDDEEAFDRLVDQELDRLLAELKR